MKELTLENFTKIIVTKLEELKDKEVILSSPKTTSQFPCTVVRTPIEIIGLIDRNTNKPITKTFNVAIEEWGKSKYEVMKMMQETSNKLRELNLIKENNDNDIYDEVTKKYRLISNYTVIYDGLYDCFKIK